MFRKIHYVLRGFPLLKITFKTRLYLKYFSYLSPFRVPIICTLLHLDEWIVVEPSVLTAWLLIFHNKNKSFMTCLWSSQQLEDIQSKQIIFSFSNGILYKYHYEKLNSRLILLLHSFRSQRLE